MNRTYLLIQWFSVICFLIATIKWNYIVLEEYNTLGTINTENLIAAILVSITFFVMSIRIMLIYKDKDKKNGWKRNK